MLSTQDLQELENQLNNIESKKAIMVILYIIVFFIVCYIIFYDDTFTY
jgi:hypothetical protein